MSEELGPDYRPFTSALNEQDQNTMVKLIEMLVADAVDQYGGEPTAHLRAIFGNGQCLITGKTDPPVVNVLFNWQEGTPKTGPHCLFVWDSDKDMLELQVSPELDEILQQAAEESDA